MPEYLYRLLSTRALKYYFEIQSVGSTMSNLNTGILLSVPVIIPPRDQQEYIVRECHALEANARESSEGLNASLELLKERMRALITAAVTGQVDPTSSRRITSFDTTTRPMNLAQSTGGM
jgi:type I restriction enzyme S subunit